MPLGRWRATNDPTGLTWPTKRIQNWAETNSITSVATAQTWLTNNVTTLAQARTVLLELLIALVQMSSDTTE